MDKLNLEELKKGLTESFAKDFKIEKEKRHWKITMPHKLADGSNLIIYYHKKRNMLNTPSLLKFSDDDFYNTLNEYTGLRIENHDNGTVQTTIESQLNNYGVGSEYLTSIKEVQSKNDDELTEEIFLYSMLISQLFNRMWFNLQHKKG